MRSLRRTLSVRFSLTMFVALLVIAFWAFLGARRVLRHELDHGLAAAGYIETSSAAAGRPVPRQGVGFDMATFVREVNRFVVLRAPSGMVLDANTPLAAGLPLDTALLGRAAAGAKVWTTGTWRGESVRSVYLPVALERPGDPRVVQVTASLGPLQAASGQVLLLMLGTVVLGTVATILGGGWLSRSVMAPVAEITEQAEGVVPGTVGQRITAHAEVEEFNRLVGVLNGMLERLDRGLLAQRRIIADVGHDLRTPITAMRGEVEVTLRHPRSPEQYQRVLESVLEEVHHLGTLSDTLLLLARIETGDLSLQRVPTDVQAVLSGAVQRVRPRAGGRAIQYEPSANGAVGTAALDGRMVGLVLDHLLDNAVRHTPEGSVVHVGLKGTPGAVVVTVEDDGLGVPEEILPHLFERFYRGDAARGRGAGAGLGLTVAAAIVRAHGGAIRAERAGTRGLRVTVELPREADQALPRA
jgi:two-component system OmpR family sensor kinase